MRSDYVVAWRDLREMLILVVALYGSLGNCLEDMLTTTLQILYEHMHHQRVQLHHDLPESFRHSERLQSSCSNCLTHLFF